MDWTIIVILFKNLLSDVEGSAGLEVHAVGQLQLDQLGTKSHQGEVEVLHGGYPGILVVVIMLI